ncbi:MAG: glycosyltransferase family 4 protein [Acidobacteriota bacterium]|nr:glycosyltransferase family 4 protein [Acidobacteriota bacterium]
MSKNFGINVAGYIDSESGLGEGARATIRALEAAKVPYVLNNCNFNVEHRKLDKSFTDFTTENPYPTNLVQLNGDQISRFVDLYGADYFKDKYNITHWSWESLEFPDDWLDALNYFDEVWTGTNFCVEAIAPVAKVPVVKIPFAINLPQPKANRKSLGLPEDKFILTFIFDFCSLFERKNPTAVVNAFEQAFGKTDDRVLLVIKTANGKLHPEAYAKLKEQMSGFSNAKLIDRYLLKDEINALMFESDCYVSLHRAEGFGLTMAEAMFYGKPVIATAYSANTDFMNPSNSFPVRFDLVTLNDAVRSYKKGSHWADPSVEHAAELMRYVFENPEKAREIGERAARDIRETLSPAAVGERIRRRLERINYLQHDFAATSPEEEIQKKLDSYRIYSERKAGEVYRLQEKIKEMQASRFWKMRNQWFKFKKAVGISNAE